MEEKDDQRPQCETGRTQQPFACNARNPAGEEHQREPGGEEEAQESPGQHEIVEEQCCSRRPESDAAVERLVQADHAAKKRREGRNDGEARRGFEPEQFRKQRNDEVGGLKRQQLPSDSIVPLQVRIARQGVHDMEASQMVRQIRQRGQRDGQKREESCCRDREMKDERRAGADRAVPHACRQRPRLLQFPPHRRATPQSEPGSTAGTMAYL